jgi:hypothetical protein
MTLSLTCCLLVYSGTCSILSYDLLSSQPSHLKTSTAFTNHKTAFTSGERHRLLIRRHLHTQTCILCSSSCGFLCNSRVAFHVNFHPAFDGLFHATFHSIFPDTLHAYNFLSHAAFLRTSVTCSLLSQIAFTNHETTFTSEDKHSLYIWRQTQPSHLKTNTALHLETETAFVSVDKHRLHI